MQVRGRVFTAESPLASRPFATTSSGACIGIHEHCGKRQRETSALWHSHVAKHARRSEENITFSSNFFLAKNESFASLDGLASLSLALGALKLKCNLLCLLGLLSEDGLGLSTETLLLGIVSALSLSTERIFSLLVLGDFVRLMLHTFGAVSSL
jgi:hypothetical protein